MKKSIFILFFVLLFFVSGCKPSQTNSGQTEYFGKYEQEKVYQQIKQIESCTAPEQLVTMLETLYGEKISFLSLTYDVEQNCFESPYEDFAFRVFSLYSTEKHEGTVTSDAYAFFFEYHESPVFIMDSKGSYLVGNYEVETLEENHYLHKVDAWVISDLYLCAHGYANCGGDTIRREALANVAKSIECYSDFESRLS